MHRKNLKDIINIINIKNSLSKNLIMQELANLQMFNIHRNKIKTIAMVVSKTKLQVINKISLTIMFMIAMTIINRITSNKISTTTIHIWIIKDHINSMLIHSTILNRIPMINSIKILTT